MDELLLQKIINNQEKIMNQLSALEKTINDMGDGQRALYVGQRNLDIELKSTTSELKFIKFHLKDDVIQKLNILVDDAQKQTIKTSQPKDSLYEEFTALRANITVEDIESFEKAKRNAEEK